jgi:hypothetical protein
LLLPVFTPPSLATLISIEAAKSLSDQVGSAMHPRRLTSDALADVSTPFEARVRVIIGTAIRIAAGAWGVGVVGSPVVRGREPVKRWHSERVGLSGSPHDGDHDARQQRADRQRTGQRQR